MKTAFTPTDILLPKAQNMKKWSVIACDQYTGDADYWEEVAQKVGDAPSTLHMILPEIYLGQPDTAARVTAIHETMQRYQREGVFSTAKNTLIYVERTLSDGKKRPGLIGALDLEEYDYSPKATTLCRATEATVAERIPPRKAVREGASLELPHVLVLIDDDQKSLIEPLADQKDQMEKVYDFDLMHGSGHLKGYCPSEAQIRSLLEGLDALRKDSVRKYGTELLYLVGDGNHSLATAKACYEDLKAKLGDAALEHPARYALVELTNLHSEDLIFEPIHRLLKNVDKAALCCALQEAFPGAFSQGDAPQSVILCDGSQEQTVRFVQPSARLTVGTLQAFLDDYLSHHPETEIDYIHEDAALRKLAAQPGNLGFLLPAIEKGAFFESILRDGTLPRKTFSMGVSDDKRFYLECRKIL